jgi:hypothetical protein
MKDLVDKLAADLRWRLSRAGKKYKPRRKERDSWGAFRIPPLASVLAWVAGFPFIIFATDGGAVPGDFAPLIGIGGVILLTYLLTGGVHQLNKLFIVNSYRKLLKENERFTLVEYARYLKRQIERAQNDPALGGQAEVERLTAVYLRLSELIRKGGANELFAVDSELGREADMAEAVIEAYDLPAADDLSDLDSQLPTELRERLQELDLEHSGRQSASKASERG